MPPLSPTEAALTALAQTVGARALLAFLALLALLDQAPPPGYAQWNGRLLAEAHS